MVFGFWGLFENQYGCVDFAFYISVISKIAFLIRRISLFIRMIL